MIEMILFTSILRPDYTEELERLLFFNQNQDKVQSDLPLLIQRYGMAHIKVTGDCLRVLLDSSPQPQTLYALARSDGFERLVGVTVYLREGDTLSLVIAAVCEDYAGTRTNGEEPLVRKMVGVLRDVARRVKGINSVTLFPGTLREKQVLVG
ncbi:hypothetical protein LCGC14_2864390, partial [marine sediment metagenome]